MRSPNIAIKYHQKGDRERRESQIRFRILNLHDVLRYTREKKEREMERRLHIPSFVTTIKQALQHDLNQHYKINHNLFPKNQLDNTRAYILLLFWSAWEVHSFLHTKSMLKSWSEICSEKREQLRLQLNQEHWEVTWQNVINLLRQEFTSLVRIHSKMPKCISNEPGQINYVVVVVHAFIFKACS